MKGPSHVKFDGHASIDSQIQVHIVENLIGHKDIVSYHMIQHKSTLVLNNNRWKEPIGKDYIKELVD